MVYNYSNLQKSPFIGYNLPVPASNIPYNVLQGPVSNMPYNAPSILQVPVSNCAQSCPPAVVPCATNSCHNHFNLSHNYYDTCHNPSDMVDFCC